jgi:hypothetical protein
MDITRKHALVLVSLIFFDKISITLMTPSMTMSAKDIHCRISLEGAMGDR